MKHQRPALEIQLRILLIATALAPLTALGQTQNAPPVEHWVSTWATAQSLAPGSGRGGRAAAAAKQAPPQASPPDHIHPHDAGNQAMADPFDLAIFRK